MSVSMDQSVWDHMLSLMDEILDQHSADKKKTLVPEFKRRLKTIKERVKTTPSSSHTTNNNDNNTDTTTTTTTTTSTNSNKDNMKPTTSTESKKMNCDISVETVIETSVDSEPLEVNIDSDNDQTETDDVSVDLNDLNDTNNVNDVNGLNDSDRECVVQLLRLPQELVEGSTSASQIELRMRELEANVFKDLDLRWCSKQAKRSVSRSLSPSNRSKMTSSRKVIDSCSEETSVSSDQWIPSKPSTSRGVTETRSKNNGRSNWTRVVESSTSISSGEDEPVPKTRITRRTTRTGAAAATTTAGSEAASPSEEKKKPSTAGVRKKRNRVISSDESPISSDNDIVKSDSDDILSLSGTDEDNKTLKKDKPKTKRRRVVTLSSGDEDSKKKDKGNKGRKNIKKLLTEKELKEETKAAGQREKERMQRISERQKLYNEVLLNELKINPEKPSRLILEIDAKTREPIVEVAPELAKQMKDHQCKGIRFMYDSVIESTSKAKEDGSGCILAHSMGLGKTFQVICFLHTLLTHKKISNHIKHALVICPVNTIKNWISEFRQWLEDDGLLTFPLFDLSDSKSPLQRGDTMKLWKQRGGVLICGLTLFAQLISPRGKKPPKWVRDITHETLLEPGPDIVVIDEGHILKNSQTAINKAVTSIATLRRIVLTGTPLQNNLDEYHVMVDFVKPNLLGTRKEFTNRFINPINNGQHIDSTPGDVIVMKKRVHVLHKLLDGCVQRFDYSVLKPYLKPKLEFIVSIRLTDKQIELYRHYLEKTSARDGSGLLADFANFRLIWNHPALLYSATTKRREAEAKRNEKDFVTTDDEESMSESDSSVAIESDKEVQSTKKSTKNGDSNSNDNGTTNATSAKEGEGSDTEVSKKWTTRTRSSKNDVKVEETPVINENDPEAEFKNCWFYPILPFMEMDKLEWSSKMIVLFYILDECEKIGDKVIVFTQSLDTLDFIEGCLDSRAREMVNNPSPYSWKHGIDYFRIDGSVSGGLRKSHIDIFNNPENLRARLFLLSTKAGGLGINLVGANRCIIFDASWNPTHDVQAIFRIYRFGQNKPVFIYRFIAQGTMEEKIYERQVYKQSLAVRVVDELQVGRHFKAQELQTLYAFDPDTREERPILNVPKDRLLADLIVSHKDLIVKYHEHDSLLENRPEEDLTEDERKSAWSEYEQEKDAQIERDRIAEELAQQRETAYREFQKNMQNQAQADPNNQQNNLPNSTFFEAYNFGGQNAFYVFMKQAQAQQQAQAQAAQAQQQAAHARAQAQASAQAFIAKAKADAAARAQAEQQQRQRQQQQQQQQQQRTYSTADGVIKSLPPYDAMTVEDVWVYVSDTHVDEDQKFQQLFRILSNGLSVVLQSLNKFKEIKKQRQLNRDEMDQEIRHKKELDNLQRQVSRAREMAKNQPRDEEPMRVSSFNRPIAEIIEEPD